MKSGVDVDGLVGEGEDGILSPMKRSPDGPS